MWIVKKRLQGWVVTDICASVKISRDMFYRWWNRYQTLGWSGLEEKPRGRPSGPELDRALKDQIVKLHERYEWGPKKIASALRHKGYYIDNNQTYKIICHAGLNHPIAAPRKT